MLFEVIKSPDGTSPQYVRDAWVGVQFQALQGAPVSMPTMSAQEGGVRKPGRFSKPDASAEISQRLGYPTNARDVLGLLALQNTEAAQWYITHAPQMLDPNQVFMFDATCCKAIADLSTSSTADPSEDAK